MPCARLGCSSPDQPRAVHYVRTHFSAEDSVETSRVCPDHVEPLKEDIRDATDKTPVAVTGRAEA